MKIGSISFRDAAVALIASLLLAAILSLPAADAIGRVSLDALFWMRQQVFGPRHDLATSPTVVIAVDEETYRRPPFNQTPFAFWTPELGEVLHEVQPQIQRSSASTSSCRPRCKACCQAMNVRFSRH